MAFLEDTQAEREGQSMPAVPSILTEILPLKRLTPLPKDFTQGRRRPSLLALLTLFYLSFSCKKPIGL